MVERNPSLLAAHWTSWGNWQPSLRTTSLILFALLASGAAATSGIEAVQGIEDHSVVGAFGVGVLPLLLGVAAIAIRESRNSLPLRILLLVFGYAILALMILTIASAASLGAEPLELSLTSLGTWGAWGLVVMVTSSLLFLPRMRILLAQVLPINANDFAHAYALALGLAAVFLSMLSLVPFGEPFIYQIPTGDIATQGPISRNVTLLATAVSSFPAVLLAVGFSKSRNLRKSLARLGFQPLTRNRILLPLLFSALLVGAGIGLGELIEKVWLALGIPVTDSESFAEFAQLPSHPLGMLLLGISAGVSEEMFVRGVMQPRLGLLFSNLLFTSAHAFQYATDGLLVVLILGFAFGIIRERYGLLPAIATHALYNFILLMLSTLAGVG